MGVTGIGIGIGIGPFDLSKPSGSALDVITSSNGAWWVVKERDGSNNLVDQTGGGRDLLLPGGSANPVLLDHSGTSYIWFPGTASNTLTTGGLSNSTAYDYKVWYLDGSTATGEETTDGSGVLTLGGTQTNFNVKKVTRIRVVADGADPDVATAVRDILASDADPDATTFTEASSNAATVTINRSSTGYKTAVVDQPMYVFATDDYMSAADAAVFDVGASDSFSVVVLARVFGSAATFPLLVKRNNLATSAVGWTTFINVNGNTFIELSDGTTEVTSNAAPGDTDSNAALTAFGGVRDTVGDAISSHDDGGLGTGLTDTTTGTLANSEPVLLGAIPNNSLYADYEVVGAAFIKGTAWTAAEISDIADALITANGGTP